MRMLLVSSKYPPEYSGSGLRAHRTCLRLIKKIPGLSATVFAGSVTDNSIAEYELDSLKVSRIACKHFPSLSSSAIPRRIQMAMNFQAESSATRRALSKMDSKPDIIHIFGRDYVSATVLNYANKRSVPTVIELCNDTASPFHYAPFPFSLSCNAMPPPKHIFVCISPRLRDMCVASGVQPERIWCRPNPVDESRFKPTSPVEKAALRRKHSVFPDEPSKLVSYVAKFSPGKNHILLLKALSRLPDTFKLLLAGPLAETGAGSESFKSLLDSIRSEIAAANLADRVILRTGFVDCVEDYYRMSDVYAFPSKMEGLGTPMLESVSCATPVAAHRIPSVTDAWIRNGHNGFLSSLEPDEFADAIAKASDIPHDTLLAESASILSKASSSAIDSEYIRIFERLASSK